MFSVCSGRFHSSILFGAPTLRAHYVVLDLLSFPLSGSDKHCLLLGFLHFANFGFVSIIHYLGPEDAVGNPERPRYRTY